MHTDGPEEREAELEEQFEREFERIEQDENYDGAPYCQYCGARSERFCDCGPIAENN